MIDTVGDFKPLIFPFAEIPHFKEVVIMATLCDQCGHKTNEVKSGGGIEPTGKKMILSVENEQDLSRDLLKVRRVLDKVCQSFFGFF